MQKQKSFTLIELLVGVSIFIVVVVIGLATVVTLNRNRSKTETISNIQTSGNLAMEIMVNRVETATSYSFISGTSTLTVSSGGKNYQFSRAVDANNIGYVGMTVSGVTGIQRLTSPDVNIGLNDLNFTGVSGSFTVKNYVTINLILPSTWVGSTETLTLHSTVIAQL